MFHDCIDIVDRSVTNDFDIIQIYLYTPILEISLNQFVLIIISINFFAPTSSSNFPSRKIFKYKTINERNNKLLYKKNTSFVKKFLLIIRQKEITSIHKEE